MSLFSYLTVGRPLMALFELFKMIIRARMLGRLSTA